MKNKALNGDLLFSKTNDFLNRYLPLQASRSTNTIETYRDGLTVFRRYITDIKKISIRKFTFTECTHDLMLDFLAYLKESGCEASTCNNRLAALRAYLWYASDMDISLQSIALSASHVPFIKEPKKKKDIISDDDLAALFAAPPDTKTGFRDRTMLILLYDSAMRISELLGLKVSSIKFSSPSSIHIHGKGEKERVVSITDKTAAHLQRYLKLYHPKNVPDMPLFYTTIKGNTSAMSQGNAARIIKKYVKQIRLDHPNLPARIYAHIFRRTRATGLYRDGVELEMVSVILGHSSTQTTRIYATPSIEMMRDAMEGSTADIPDEEAEWLTDDDELARLCGLR
jgi:integrase/recombinase XerD